MQGESEGKNSCAMPVERNGGQEKMKRILKMDFFA